MNTPIYIPMDVAVDIVPLTVSVTANSVSLGMELGAKIVVSDSPAYTGPTEVTPSAETQVLETVGTVLLENITVNPIPNNYGLITWNGSVLTVS